MENLQKTIEVKITYERAQKYFDGGGEYFPTMEDGSIVVRKMGVGVGDRKLFGGSKYGVINRDGMERVPCIYDLCSPINKNYYIVANSHYEYRDSAIEGRYGSEDRIFLYGIVDKQGKEVIPLEMKRINFFEGYVYIVGANDEYYIGILDQNGKLKIMEGLRTGIIMSSLDLIAIYNDIQNTKKVAVLNKGFLLKGGDYSSYEDFEKAYHEFINKAYASQNENDINNQKRR